MAQAKEDAYSEVIDVALVVKIDVVESIVTANSLTTVFSHFGNRFQGHHQLSGKSDGNK